MSLLSKPYHMLALWAVLLIMLSFIPISHAMDMPVQGASYVLSYVDTLRAGAMLLLLLWILYMITIRILFSAVLIWIHIVITLLLMAFIVFLFFRLSGHDASGEVKELSFQTGIRYQMMVPVLILLLLLTQLMYIINLLLGVMRRVN
ncbi:hypothetical protein [Agriterribacter sp.]|uniref:hypothetical protein n=1 Tax=Agriterribacter sp. TaxID=2821509 RepID=UPI002BFA4882|nr:hypothetical protein [Agriterribacter sp.]HTN08954.1 hypothetical protein [Agriterribacter sp.]